jgi:hypothetical protein
MNSKIALRNLLILISSTFTASAAVDLGVPASGTPYEPYMRPVKQVLSRLNGDGGSMEKVKQLMKEGKSFRYSFTEPYMAALPEVTAKVKAGDCKAKSLWLVNQLGDKNVRYVIGKARRTSKISHAWVMWNDGGRWWILDCTNTSKPIPADSVSSGEYIPLYSYDGSRSYRHSATSTFTASATAANAPVAAEADSQK